MGGATRPKKETNMKKIFLTMVILLLVCYGFAYAGSGRESTKLPPQEVEIFYSSEDHAYQMKDLSDVVRWKVLPDGSFANYDTSGQTRFFVDGSGNITAYNSSGGVESYSPSSRTVYIDSTDDLSTLSGQASTAGQSYFQTEPGKTYIVDPHAIATTGCAPGGTSAMGTGTFSAVSAFLPDASTYEGPAYDVRIVFATIGATGYAVALTGSTGVQVWPFPGTTGLTAYGLPADQYDTAYRSANTPQTLATVYSANGTLGTHRVASGVSYWEIDKLNESATFGLENGSVSAFVKERNIVN